MSGSTLILAVAVMVAGGLGAVLRLALGKWVGILPWGILAANTLASLLAGFAMNAVTSISIEFQTVIVIGLAGGLSTFSSFAGQTVDYFRRGRIAQGLSNILLNMVFVCTAVALGLWLAAILLK
jgi:fluoride exporter